MHFRNGREAKNGDKVVMIQNGRMFVGVLIDAMAGNDYCNGQLAQLPPTTYCNLKECLHMDDAAAALAGDVPSTVKPDPAPATPDSPASATAQ